MRVFLKFKAPQFIGGRPLRFVLFPGEFHSGEVVEPVQRYRTRLLSQSRVLGQTVQPFMSQADVIEITALVARSFPGA